MQRTTVELIDIYMIYSQGSQPGILTNSSTTDINNNDVNDNGVDNDKTNNDDTNKDDPGIWQNSPSWT